MKRRHAQRKKNNRGWEEREITKWLHKMIT